MNTYSGSFATWLKKTRVAVGLSQKDLAIKTNISPYLISKYETGKVKPRAENITKIYQSLASLSNEQRESLVKIDDLLVQQYLSTLVEIPFLLENENELQEHISIDTKIIPRLTDTYACMAYTAKGNAMSPVINDGSCVILDTFGSNHGTDFLLEHYNTDIFLVGTSGTTRLKQVILDGNMLILRSFNKSYPDEIIAKDSIDLIARVIIVINTYN